MPQRGQVTFFNEAKGYGIITPESNPEGKVFAHFTSILAEEPYTLLEEGQVVDYESISSPKGEIAIKIWIVQEAV